jgi:hypothetical protein
MITVYVNKRNVTLVVYQERLAESKKN